MSPTGGMDGARQGCMLYSVTELRMTLGSGSGEARSCRTSVGSLPGVLVACGLWLSMGYRLVFSGLVFWQAWPVVE